MFDERGLEVLQVEIQESCKRINEDFGQQGYEPIVSSDRSVPLSDKAALHTVAKCFVVTVTWK